MTTQQAEICSQVANIISCRPEEFTMAAYEHYNEKCGSVACVAGHIGIMHRDSYRDWHNRGSEEFRLWLERQGSRIGLDYDAARMLFEGAWVFMGYENENDVVVRLLLAIGDHTANSDVLLTKTELISIGEAALQEHDRFAMSETCR